MEIPPEQKTGKSDEGFGPIVGIVIIVGLIAIGGIYFLVTQEIQRHAPAEDQVNS
jgi:hypothetical protein